MNITVIYATGRKAQSGSYNIAQLLIRALLGEDELFSFHLPRDMPHICVDCYACIRRREEACGGAAAFAPILAAMQRSEQILFCTPTYAFHVPGQMKTLPDHLAYRWMVHHSAARGAAHAKPEGALPVHAVLLFAWKTEDVGSG